MTTSQLINDLRASVGTTEMEYKRFADLVQLACHRIEAMKHKNLMLREERLMLARLAAETPQFYNPLQVAEAIRLRDDILSNTSVSGPHPADDSQSTKSVHG
jgi:hypothetical protein